MELLLLPGASDRRAAVRAATPQRGLEGCDPSRFALLGYAHDRRGPATAAAATAYPELLDRGRARLAPGEERLGVWRAVTAVGERRAPGGARLQARRRWRGASGPTVTLTDRRLIVHGASAEHDGAHVGLERVRRARAVLGPVRGRVHVEVLLHCVDSGASAVLELSLVLRRRGAGRLVHALAAAHGRLWGRYDLPAQVSEQVANAGVRRTAYELRLDPVVHIPLGLADAISGPGAGPGVPQRLRAHRTDDPQAALGASRSANAPASSS